ncbi:protein POLR1D [Apteryx rowi]|nr:PREDICTED: DNA-directed RNA polymerases I and III subunit RPAC2 [Apteryx mantelli mantelli]XP_025930115.1 protein POLR1D [Apteryx rowi]
MGAMGWLKCPLAGANKRFLINTIKNTLPSQKEQDQGHEPKEVSKEPDPNKSRKEEKPKKRRIHPYTPSFQSRRRVSYSPPRHRNRTQQKKDKYEKQSSKR